MDVPLNYAHKGDKYKDYGTIYVNKFISPREYALFFTAIVLSYFTHIFYVSNSLVT